MNWRLVTSTVTMAMVLVRVDSKIVVDGAWSPWSTVRSYCVDPAARHNLVTCGGGVETKYRSCTNPAPQGGGQDCIPEERPDGLPITTKKVRSKGHSIWFLSHSCPGLTM